MLAFKQNPVSGDPRAAFAPVPSDTVYANVLAANTAERVAIPAGANFVSLSATKDFRAKFGDATVTATVPSGDVSDGSASVLNPAVRMIKGKTHISLISTEACEVTLEFWK